MQSGGQECGRDGAGAWGSPVFADKKMGGKKTEEGLQEPVDTRRW